MNRSLTVLVVEDHQTGAGTLSELILAAGHEPVVAASGREAMYMAARYMPDVVLMDIGLPDMDGYEAARRVCALLPQRPALVAITGFPWLKDQSLLEGFDHHLVKPVEPEELQELLQSYAEDLVHVA